MIIGALDVDPPEALVRLRAPVYAHDLTAVEVAWRSSRLVKRARNSSSARSSARSSASRDTAG